MTTIKLVKAYSEVGDIKTFVFEKGDATWQAGQYQTYTLPRIKDPDAAKRYFTIASAPSEQEIHISTRVTDSEFKQTLNKLQPGDSIEASGIEGDFTWTDDSEVILIAAGIGVTPYRSMLLERIAQNKTIPATLLYFSRDDDFAFREELENLQADHPEFTVRYICRRPVTAETILAYAPKAAERPVYLSGPEAMVDSVGTDLVASGVTLKLDWFPGYDEQSY